MWSRYRLRRVILSVLFVCGVLWLADVLDPLPLPKDDMARVVLAQDGTPLWRFADHNGVWRYPIRIDQVSPYYLEALLGYEDRWFYQHPGINPLSIARAAWQNLSGGRVVSGGSTLSMQVARLLDPHPRTLRGKLRQVWRTAQLEWHLSKDEILTLYLNRAPFGGTLEGVAAASWAYLGKSPKNLSRAEAALLAVLPQAPSRLRPDRHPERAQAARDKILQRLQQFKVWPQAAITDALQERVWLAPRDEPSLAPLLARRLNTANSTAVIETTLDASLQRRLEELLLGWRARLPERTSAAIIVVEHESMAVQAYLGSLDIQDAQRFGHVDMIQAVRSPGSTLKPFLYGLTLDEGLIHSESLLQDVPRHAGDYRPGNFSQGFSGPVAASQALSRSLNVPVVQLLEVYGPKRFAGELRNSGVPLLLPRDAEPNLALILGGVGTRLENVVSGFSAFARQGKVAQLRFQPQQALQEKPLMVYKMVAIENEHGEMEDTIKISSNAEKVTTPGLKNVYRIINRKTGKAEGDYIAMQQENPSEEQELYMFHPVHTYLSKTVTHFEAVNLHRHVIKSGEVIYELPTLEEIRQYGIDNLNLLWEEYKRSLNPEEYPVDLSQMCWDNKMRNMKEVQEKVKQFIEGK